VFLAGVGLFQGIIWGINAKMNPETNGECYKNEEVVITVYTVMFVLSALLLLITFIIKAIKKPRIIKVAQQYLFHPTQQFVKNTDGSLTVKMRTGGLRAISVFLAQWGGDIIPVKPAALLTEYENLLKNCYNSIRPEEDLSSK
jgi:hypothetical protein